MSWIKLTSLPEQRLPMHIDKQKSFWEIKDGQIIHQNRINRKADVESFEILEGSDFIARDKTYIYNAWTTLINIDRDSFKSLGDGYYQDKHCGYFDFEASMKPLKGETVEKLKVIGAGYARDIKHAYYCGRVIKKCESPLSFTLVPQTGEHPIPAATDAENCYYEGGLIAGADVESWTMVGNGFSKDAKHVFFGSKKLSGAKASDWAVIKHPYSMSGNKVYFMSFALKGADLDSFEILPDGTARDKISLFQGKNREV